MLKLLVCILSSLLLAILVLQMRQQKLELNYQTNQLHSKIENTQAKLWSQQVQIAIHTAPNAIAQTVGGLDLKMTPPSVLPSTSRNWIDTANDPDAE